METRFKDRYEAGERLAEKLMSYSGSGAAVLALPRGGVPVAYAVATALRTPLDTVVARKIGMPGNREYGVGAIAPGGVLILDDSVLASLGTRRRELDLVIEEETAEMNRRIARYKSGAYVDDEATIILVDDGLATGVTARAGIESVRKNRNPKRLIFAAPVCARDAAFMLRAYVDDVVCLSDPADLMAVGYWYDSFVQTTDEEVEMLLEKANAAYARQR
jgi:putative phosphoribosyl transferase